ncbi:hypothetical protein EGY05_02120 [Chryseobacterium arthrosphaerae]|uniref:hypothetical protein n=1 Tax=Chryseobacterium arthrosphaerae TaxID=651561 RepID=UPI000F51194F|nr:hypothetical protein [Chryseobacterium arthrosphaerae]AYZ10811.1 hypothetical protein EGY05_02120 [Chryseobacterium arthrosphaerae]
MIRDFFSYHYYRVAKFYYKRDGADATTALISVSAVQGWIIINILLFIKETLFNNEKLKYGWVVFLVVMIGILFYNKKKYKNKYLELRSKWINEEKNNKIFNGILVILTIIFSWSLIFINLLILKKIY